MITFNILAYICYLRSHWGVVGLSQHTFVSRLSWTVAQVTAFQKLVIPSSQTLSNTTNFKTYVDILYILLYFSNYLNCTKRIENCSMVASIVSKSKKI